MAIHPWTSFEDLSSRVCLRNISTTDAIWRIAPSLGLLSIIGAVFTEQTINSAFMVGVGLIISNLSIVIARSTRGD
ncbi:MAG: hypothetical protein AAF225_00925, partial [Pseudomonadota bacterium]